MFDQIGSLMFTAFHPFIFVADSLIINTFRISGRAIILLAGQRIIFDHSYGSTNQLRLT